MSSKRGYAEVEASGPSRDGGNKRRKQYKNRSATGNDGSNGPSNQSLNELKKRARDIQRRFTKVDNMPPDIQRNLERELAQCKAQIGDLGRKKRRSDMIGKYHHVRFYERQKAERLRKQLKKRLDKADDPEEKAKLQQEFHIADVDWHYAKYYPFMERYVGLYLTANTAEKKSDESKEVPTAKRALHAERPPMWKVIEAAMEEGQRALEALQERTSDVSAPAPAPQAHSRPRNSSGKKDGEVESKEKKPKIEKKHGKASKLVETKDTEDTDVPLRAQRKAEQEKAERRNPGEGENGSGFFSLLS